MLRLVRRSGWRVGPRHFSAEVKPSDFSEVLRNLRASEHFDLVVIGSGPAGQKCAIDSAKHGKKVAIIDKKDMHGGVCVHTGTIPSKTFREAVLHLTAHRHKGFYGNAYTASTTGKRLSLEEILDRVKKVEDAETDLTRNQLTRNGIILINGTARFLPTEDKKTIAVLSNDSYTEKTDAQRHNDANICKRVLTADKVLIAVGTRPARRPDLDYDGRLIFDSDQLLWGGVDIVPKRLIVVGAGVIGMEYASMISIIPGTQVTVIDGRKEILDMADKEVSDALCYYMRKRGSRFLTEESIVKVETKDNSEVLVYLTSGKVIVGDALLYTQGRQVRRLASVHMRPSEPTNKLRPDAEAHDPAHPRTRMRSGEVFPFGIYTVPEISMVGKSEQQLSRENIPYEVGIARYEELAKGQMMGGMPGFLKLIFCPTTLKLLGVHAIGEGATEIIHIGQVVMSTGTLIGRLSPPPSLQHVVVGCVGGTMEYFRNAVFNYPTLAEAYRVAGLNGLSKIEALRNSEV
ncbi:hypothetical protein DYB31_004630 [Aphanomyces astaci]|uniref:NAD(P)(+) transhydrogenase (Si-specific) n=1 Tax=Aphanomyces astaci TaxID=112090 RepID=A0A397EVV4_APHAT|nr:hypothetical protein DYB31_004630 [Aphanomyces astaci]